MVTGPMLMVIFLIAIAFVLISIIKFKLNPFISLIAIAIITAFLVNMPIDKIASTVTAGFGNTLTGIGIVIGFGIILGEILSEAGATEQIANTLLKRVGMDKAPLAVNLTGIIVSIPVFFDAAFVILISLIKTLSRKTKKPLIVFVTALAVGLISTHALVIPTPGPLAVAGNMKLNIGVFVLYSLIVSIPAALVGGWVYGLFLGRRYKYDETLTQITSGENEMASTKETAKVSKPSGALSIAVILFPIILILLGTSMALVLKKGSLAMNIFSFIGDKNVSMLLGVFVAILTMKKYIEKPINEVIVKACESSGLILLITGAGGAFGNVINASGIGKYLVTTLSGWHISVLVLGFILSQILRAAQGSTTVALVTTSSILGPVVAQVGASPILVGLAICAGGIGISLPNDSGFWVIQRFTKMSVTDTLKSWTLGGTICGFTAFAIVLILDLFRGILPGLM